MKDLNYWKENATENYMTTPISVLRYITELEKNNEDKQLILSGVSQQRELLDAFVCTMEFDTKHGTYQEDIDYFLEAHKSV
jgi:hypothetical protein